MSLQHIRPNNTLNCSNHNKKITYDIHFKVNKIKKPLVIFVHGFKGFKDWGTFNLLSEFFAERDFVYTKFNFSHNGTTPDQPDEFSDLEAFGHNTFSKELNDVQRVINFMLHEQDHVPEEEIDPDQLFLVGHSRGGGIAILSAHQDDRVKGVAAWAAISDFALPWKDKMLEAWKKAGVHYIENSRTGQRMPLYYDIVEDYFQHKDKLHIPGAVAGMNKPMIAFHGTLDETLPLSMLEAMKTWNPNIKAITLQDANHTFGAAHPWKKDHLPNDMKTVAEETIKFFNNTL